MCVFFFKGRVLQGDCFSMGRVCSPPCYLVELTTAVAGIHRVLAVGDLAEMVIHLLVQIIIMNIIIIQVVTNTFPPI